MKNRLEYKYLVPLSYIDRLRNNLLIYLEPDDYASVRPNHEYTVRSIYLDSYDYGCYYEKLDGIHSRKKFRVRGYNTPAENSPVFYEIKRKYDNFISKDRAGIRYADMHEALDRMRPDLYAEGEERRSYANFCHHYRLRRLEPKVLVVYEREPFECKFGSKLRITFDKRLRSRIVSGYEDLFNDDGLVECFRKEFILEVKFFQVLPQWISRVLEKYNLTRMAVSKYTSSIDAHQHSMIAFNKFTRTEFMTGYAHATESRGSRPIFADPVPDFT